MCFDFLLFVRNASESYYHAKIKASRKYRDEIGTASQKMKEQMILAGASDKLKTFEAILQLAFETDKASIEYLSSFHTVLGMSLQHSKLFSEKVNVDMMRRRKLKRALNELVDGDIGAINERSVRSRGDASPSPSDLLHNSELKRTTPSHHLIINQLSAEESVNEAGNAIHRARNTFLGMDSYDSEAMERQRQGAVYDSPQCAQPQQPASSGSVLDWASSFLGFLSPTGNSNDRIMADDDIQLPDL